MEKAISITSENQINNQERDKVKRLVAAVVLASKFEEAKANLIKLIHSQELSA